MKCALCSKDDGGQGTRQVARLSVCEACVTASYLPERLRDRGLHLSYSYRTEAGIVDPAGGGLDGFSSHTFSVLAEAPNASEINARLQFEGFSAKVIKIFQHEIQVGNKEFDDAVWIRTNTEQETHAFLALSGVQEAILPLIEEQGEIDIDGARIYVKVQSKLPIETQSVILKTAALLHYLTEFSEP